jgi:hypothetical protein
MGVFSREKVLSKANTDKKSKGKQGICDLEAFFRKPKPKGASQSHRGEETLSQAEQNTLRRKLLSRHRAAAAPRPNQKKIETRSRIGQEHPPLYGAQSTRVLCPVKALAVEGGVPKEPSVANLTEVSRPASGKSSLGPHNPASQCVGI